MELWIAASLAAALFQTVRFMLQKHLAKVSLSAAGATFARFVYSAPVAVLVLLIVLWGARPEVSVSGAAFWTYGVVGGAAQITATVCTVMLFGRRNLAVGMTLIKSEVLLTVLIGLVVLGERISGVGLAAIVVGVAGVLILSGPVEGGVGLRRFWTPSAALGIAAGALFGVSAVCYRGATLEVASDAPLLRALVTLAAVTSMQMVGLWVWLRVREPGEVARVLGAWRTAGFVGLTSMAGSFSWFVAFTLQNAAYVKAVGQIELVFGIIATVLFFREKISGREFAGIGLLAISILGLIVWS
ncbi:DMT family transporter [Shimia abyssi]|uniref:EamA-like transporter family protein n=1 Tax=Shimia abyssi TaxID=1662395 RepID=A0A2P8FD69_9RHOB|nr:DMT family transporter [Shimia abyssi]PSL19665.1 EamA-like transporter family protein [Shimia abyssi]